MRRLQAHRRGGAFWRGFEAELDAGVVAVLVADVEGVVAVARRLPQGLRAVGLPQQLAVGEPGVGRHTAPLVGAVMRRPGAGGAATVFSRVSHAGCGAV